MKTPNAPAQKPTSQSFQVTSSDAGAYFAGMQSLGITDTGVIMDSYRRFLNYVMWSAKGASTTVHVEILRGLRGWTTVHFSRSP